LCWFSTDFAVLLALPIRTYSMMYCLNVCVASTWHSLAVVSLLATVSQIDALTKTEPLANWTINEQIRELELGIDGATRKLVQLEEQFVELGYDVDDYGILDDRLDNYEGES
jgi:hypothetical protein